MSCPFFGHSLWIRTRIIAPSHGNQCALVTNAHSPCTMETSGQRPSWEDCDRNPAREAAGERPTLTQIAEYVPAATAASDRRAALGEKDRAEYLRGAADATAWVIGLLKQPPKP